MKIAIQGEPGSFSHEAALQFDPGGEIAFLPYSTEVFAALSGGDVDAAAIPIENSLAGSVLEHFDLLLKHDVTVVAEILIRIRHNLIAMPGTRIDELEQALSHPVALAQCRRFLGEHPAIRPSSFYDTAGSVKHVIATGDRKLAAIASASAALIYHAKILAADIEDNPENYTRFFLVRRSADAQIDPAANKLSLAFSVENRPGSLVAVLFNLATMGTNLTKIESRPVQGSPWEYVFYVDCQIHSMEEGNKAIAALMPHCAMVKELGRYCDATQD